MKNIKAIIFDLDNTIYAVESISDALFKDLFDLIRSDGRFEGDFGDVQDTIKRKPFQFVSEQFRFDPELTNECTELLSDLVHEGPIQTFEEFSKIGEINCKKFLVTTGFMNLQWSKIKKLRLEQFFEEIFIVDPQTYTETKKDIFNRIVCNYRFNKNEVLVLGDDLNSEIKAGEELGLKTVVFDYEYKFSGNTDQKVVNNYRQFMGLF
ncbi:HAD family hydrolase [Sphingobacterium siyangense]|uniref:HAD family hydrolase n=1 Tax=Sphingobacterium TaxID=28453 RepID=UPI000958A708|nr:MULTISPECIES: HAD family hydrolase [Sphingobacterium]APU99765.1 hypothetical protein BV902_13885 [Sphingobacterium sp. B29]UQA77717.1 HAD family hydrolase [Sphingobacterium siyangense]